MGNEPCRNNRCKAYVVMAGAACLTAGIVLPVVGLGTIVALNAIASILGIGDFVEQDAAVIPTGQFQALHGPMRIMTLAHVDLMDQGDEFASRKASSGRCRLGSHIDLSDNEIGAAGHHTGSVRRRCGTTVGTLIRMAYHAVFRINTTAVRGGSSESCSGMHCRQSP